MEGMSPGFVLFVVFLVLKLTHVIAWSWLWVTAPLWISFGVGLLVVVLAALGAGTFFGVKKLRGRNRQKIGGSRTYRL